MNPKKTTQTTTLPTLESMPQAHAVTGMPLSIIREAKRAGCSAFVSGNRIRLEPLLKWFFAEFEHTADKPPGGLSTWREALNRAQTKREELRLAVDSAKLMPIDEIRRQNGEAWSFVFAELERLANEVSPALAGLPAVEVYTRLNDFKEQMRKNAKEKFEQV